MHLTLISRESGSLNSLLPSIAHNLGFNSNHLPLSNDYLTTFARLESLVLRLSLWIEQFSGSEELRSRFQEGL